MIPGFLQEWAGRMPPLEPRTIILAYHRVVELDSDPQLLAVAPENFRDQLEALQELGRIVPLAEGDLFRKGRNREGFRFIITFDDGYFDNNAYAKDILESADAPATFFVSSSNIGMDREFWWDDLERLVLIPEKLPSGLTLETPNGRLTWQLDGSPPGDKTWNVTLKRGVGERQRLYLELHALLKPLAPCAQNDILDQLAKWTGEGKRARSSHRLMTSDEVASLSHGRHIEIGSHSSHHQQMSTLTWGEKRKAVEVSKQELEEIIGKRITSFSYPFGGKGDIDRNTVRCVREGGFERACANFPGRVGPLSDRYRLTRYLVRNWNADQFEKHVHSWLNSV